MIFGEELKKQARYERNVAYIVLTNEQLIGIIQSPRGYYLVGGGIEETEQPRDCIEREALEELGALVDIGELIGEVSVYRHSQTYQGVLYSQVIFYQGTLKAVVQAPLEKEYQLVWLTKEEAMEKLTLPHQRWALQQTTMTKEEEWND